MVIVMTTLAEGNETTIGNVEALHSGAFNDPALRAAIMREISDQPMTEYR